MTPLAVIRHVGIAAALAAVVTVAGAAPGELPADYAYAIPIYPSDLQAIVPLLLPRDAYLLSKSSDLNDLRVFDADGVPMPFAVIPQPRVDRETTELQKVAVFPVRTEAAGNARAADSLQVRTSETGTVISVNARPTDQHDKREVLAALLLDLQAGEGAKFDPATAPVAGLQLALPESVKNYHARVAIDISPDLRHWSDIGESTLEWVQNGDGLVVRQDRVDVPADGARYARIRWLEGAPVEFTIVAERARRTVSNLRWNTLTVQPQAGRVANDLVYPTPPAISVERVGLALLGTNAVVPAVLGHYVEAPSRKHRHAAGIDFAPVVSTTFYQLQKGSQRRAALEVTVPGQHATHWVLRPSTPLQERPALRISWTPATLVFLTTGRAPYSLAVGRAGAAPARQPIERVAPGFTDTDLAALEHALAGTPVRQAAAATTLSSSDGRRRPLLIAAFWATLVAGVSVLAYMAWRMLAPAKTAEARAMRQPGNHPTD